MIFFFISYRTLFLFCYIQNGKNMRERTIYKNKTLKNIKKKYCINYERFILPLRYKILYNTLLLYCISIYQQFILMLKKYLYLKNEINENINLTEILHSTLKFYL
ncbi:hypothetical protein PFUGPA_01618 [Plasmodium falciparum Palo Alto/Uganda]|uniref:Uncharacterized protein n=4 Tax=Plasmodium falciparum TaxID=5833 RepID=W4J4E3_PLAFP|nr:hypothetical protein PFTANZ_03120 [Plasmodium falciparum Tanzania (2000708)]ETW56447.1 hypothetical protein PFUGPA_01618 [Plasmodium falciparum Palo Alto/Uganda]ETW61174.1 hypothetical protein PFMC_03038 [Plasmodium falciparum CAMP/Malaysia]EUR71401.1 hypothetical protein PFBG_03125 [Plasmodium falciparum 7G8]